MNRTDVLIIACFALVFTIGLIPMVKPSYAILGLPDNFNNNDSNDNNISVQTQPQQQPQQQEQTPIEGFSSYQDPASLFTIQYLSLRAF